MACSMPPMYWSTGSQRSTAERSVGSSSRVGSVKRAKYQDESTKVSMVSVSRRPAAPHFGHGTWRHAACRSSGFPGMSKETSSGKVTGKSAIGTGTMPQASQWMTGIGQPQ
jgi:hypothetical protein